MERKEIRFLIDKKIYNELQKEANKRDIPLASYIKCSIKNWRKKYGRR